MNSFKLFLILLGSLYAFVLPDTLYYALGVYTGFWFPFLESFLGYLIVIFLLIIPFVNILLAILLIFQSFHVSFKFLIGIYEPSSFHGYITMVLAMQFCLVAFSFLFKNEYLSDLSKLKSFNYKYAINPSSVILKRNQFFLTSPRKTIKKYLYATKTNFIDPIKDKYYVFCFSRPWMLLVVCYFLVISGPKTVNWPGLVNIDFWVMSLALIHAVTMIGGVGRLIELKLATLSLGWALRNIINLNVLLFLVSGYDYLSEVYFNESISPWLFWFGTSGLN